MPLHECNVFLSHINLDSTCGRYSTPPETNSHLYSPWRSAAFFYAPKGKHFAFQKFLFQVNLSLREGIHILLLCFFLWGGEDEDAPGMMLFYAKNSFDGNPLFVIPSLKLTYSHEKSPCSIGKTSSMGPFSIVSLPHPVTGVYHCNPSLEPPGIWKKKCPKACRIDSVPHRNSTIQDPRLQWSNNGICLVGGNLPEKKGITKPSSKCKLWKIQLGNGMKAFFRQSPVLFLKCECHSIFLLTSTLINVSTGFFVASDRCLWLDGQHYLSKTFIHFNKNQWFRGVNQ